MNPSLNQSGCTLIVLAEWKPPVYSNSGIKVITSSIRRNSPHFLDSKIHHNNLINNIIFEWGPGYPTSISTHFKWFFSNKKRPTGSISALFLIFYGFFRFLIEFTREPDNFLGLLYLNLSMGQWLTIPMIGLGLCMYFLTKNKI